MTSPKLINVPPARWTAPRKKPSRYDTTPNQRHSAARNLPFHTKLGGHHFTFKNFPGDPNKTRFIVSICGLEYRGVLTHGNNNPSSTRTVQIDTSCKQGKISPPNLSRKLLNKIARVLNANLLQPKTTPVDHTV
jgi:hypothetical protein